MPPKKEEAKKIPLGKFSNHLKMGIVGLPNVGKSTLFNILSKSQVPAANFLFCTKEPNVAFVKVPDPRFDKLCKLYTRDNYIPSQLQIVDIAGLIKGSSLGQGLGNQFLSHIAAVDGIFHVVRAFDDLEIIHANAEVNPINDMETIYSELLAKDKMNLEGIFPEIEKTVKRTNDKDAVQKLSVLKKVEEVLKKDLWIKDTEWTSQEIYVINSYNFLTAKIVVYLVNISSDDYIKKGNKYLPQIMKWVQEHGGGPIIPFSCTFEIELENMEKKEEFCKEKKCTSAIGKIIKTGYSSIHLIHFFTIGKDELKCWTIKDGTVAKKAAGVIHTDFEEGFICAEIMKFKDLEEHGNETEVKAAGKVRQQGKDYVVEDGDIVFFRFNVSRKKSK